MTASDSQQSLDREDVDHVARLAYLSLSDDELEALTDELRDILDYVDKLATLDTDDVAPTTHAAALRNVLRDDKPQAGLSQEEALANAPVSEAGCFRVPAIIEGDS